MSPRTVIVVTAPFRPEGSDQDDRRWRCAVCRVVDPEDRGNTARICGNPSDFVPRRVIRVMALHRGSQSARELAFHGMADTHGGDAIRLSPLRPTFTTRFVPVQFTQPRISPATRTQPCGVVPKSRCRVGAQYKACVEATRESAFALRGPSNLSGKIGVRGEYTAHAVTDNAAGIRST